MNVLSRDKQIDAIAALCEGTSIRAVERLTDHAAAVGLYVAHYNLCRVHEALRVTPAMALGVTDHIWSIGELIDVALGEAAAPKPEGRQVGRFRVIDGGRS